MRIVVCLKVVPKPEQVKLDPVTKRMDRSGAESEINEPDKNALEMALALKESHGGRVTILSMGPPLFEPFLKLAVAMGADDAVLLSDRAFAGADTYATAYALARAIEKMNDYDLILCGEESSDASTGQVPPALAEFLGIPQITYVAALTLRPDGRILGRRTIRGGHESVAAPLPALVSVELGVNTPRFPDFRRKRWADKEFTVTVWDAAALGVDPAQVGLPGSMTTVGDLVEKVRTARQGERIEGTPEEVARRLSAIIEPFLRA